LKASAIHKDIEKKAIAKKKKAKKKAKSNKKKTIYETLELSKYETYESIHPAKKAWITIHAKKQGKDPNKVKAQIRAKMKRIAKK
jgi:predicted secreted protein